MRWLIISHEFPPIGGGGANACFFLSREFAKQKLEVDVVTAEYDGLPQREETRDNVHVYRVKCQRSNTDKSTFYEMLTFVLSAWKFVNQLCKQKKYDKCLVFFGIPSGPIALFLKKKYEIPYVVRLGGGDIPGAQKRFRHLYRVLSPVIRWIWREADFLIANSQGLKERAQCFESKYPITIIENGVDSSFFCPGHGKMDRDTVNVLFVSRLIEGKGLQFILPELRDVDTRVRQKSGKGVKVTVVGDGPYRGQLEKLVRENNLEQHVSFEGKKNKSEVKEFYQKADLFILPSLSEGMPNVVLEAMASGLPILMTPCEGSIELVTNNGVISELDSFVDNMVELCSKKELLTEMGYNSLQNVKDRFQWSQIAQKYLEVIG